jgi:hypothetical protein
MFDILSMLAGIFFGFIILLLIMWIVYTSRTFIFVNCARERPYCVDNDYINDPGEAVRKGYNPEQFLHITSDNELYYRRIKRTQCVQHTDQMVHIEYPQFCEVGGEIVRHVDGNIYRRNNGTQLTLGRNCGYGVPLKHWESS